MTVTTRESQPPIVVRKSSTGPFFFMRQFLRDQQTIGAISRSSRSLGLNMVKTIDFTHAGAIAEFGPGTGAFTGVILEKLAHHPKCKFFAVEKNDAMAAEFRHRFPKVKLYEDDARHIRAICDAEGVKQLDAVVSGLPFMVFPRDLQEGILRETVKALKPGGTFVTFTYRIDGLGRARRFRTLLESHFKHVKIGGLTISNIPPAVVFRCTA